MSGFPSLWTLILDTNLVTLNTSLSLTGSSIQKGGGETLPEYGTITATKLAASKERENIKMLQKIYKLR